MCPAHKAMNEKARKEWDRIFSSPSKKDKKKEKK